MTHVPYMSPPPARARATPGLLTFGVISIIIGSLCGLLAQMMPLSMAMMSVVPTTAAARRPQMQVGTMLSAMVLYVVISAAFISTGIGACKARRWVRPVVLSIAWPGLIMGLLTMPLMIPIVMSPHAPTPGVPPQMMTVIAVVSLVFMGLIYIVLPLTYILFFQRASVKETLERCDPHPRWTDRCPIQVLGLSLWLCFMAAAMVMMMQFMCVPAFGYYITGWPAIAVTVAVMTLLFWAALQCYRLRPAGWWAAMGFLIVWLGSAILTFGRNGIMDFYRHANMPPEQLAILEKQAFMHGSRTILLMISTNLVLGGYLLYVRRFFKSHNVATA